MAKKERKRIVAALPQPVWNESSSSIPVVRIAPKISDKKPQQLEFSGVFRGHELTRKDRRLSSGLAPLDALIDGGIPRGRISEITGRAGSGKTSMAASFAAFATRRGEVAAWLDASGAFDPESMAAAGVELRRMLWASMKTAAASRIARAAERSGAAVIAIAPWRMCGTFAALSLVASRAETSFSRLAPGSPVMFDGLAVDAMVTRNKMGGTGRRVRVRALVDPIPVPADAHSQFDRKESPAPISASS